MIHKFALGSAINSYLILETRIFEMNSSQVFYVLLYALYFNITLHREKIPPRELFTVGIVNSNSTNSININSMQCNHNSMVRWFKFSLHRQEGFHRNASANAQHCLCIRTGLCWIWRRLVQQDGRIYRRIMRSLKGLRPFMLFARCILHSYLEAGFISMKLPMNTTLLWWVFDSWI